VYTVGQYEDKVGHL